MHLHKTRARYHATWLGPPQLLTLATVLLSAFIRPTIAADPATCPGCPCFSESVYEESISEAVPIGTTAVTVIATDDPADVLTYSILGTADFMIDSITGDITVHNQLDFETTGSYTFLAQVSDSTHIVTATIVLNIIDENESVLRCNQSLFYVSIVEGLPMNHSFSLHCMDTNDPMSTQLHYEITAGDEDAAFDIDSFGNVLVVGSLDYESESRHELIITVSIDGMSPPQVISTLEVFVLVEPVNEFYPVFSTSIYEFDISESTSIGAFIGQVSAADLDSGDDGIIAFVIESGVTGYSQHFSISPATGDIFLSQLLDFESTVAISHQLEFMILASDSSPSESQRLTSSASVVVHILDSNDHTPTFAQALYYAQVAEDMEAGMEILQVVCDDEDSGPNQEITYSILSGNEGGEFAILATGKIVLTSSLDYDEGIQLYRLTAECRDNGNPVLSSEVAIVVEITSVNEFYPQPEVTSVTVSEDTLPGTAIAEIVAQDLDRGAAGILVYLLVFNSYCPEELFYIDSRTGMVYLAGSLDFERGVRNISCIVMVRDSQQPSRIRESSLSITVTDVNDEPPSCNPPVHIVSIPEDSLIGSEILTFSCMDPDSSTLQYSVSGANDSVLPFRLASLGSLAKLTVLAELDADSQPLVYTVPIHVSDGSITTELTVKIFVSNVNEFAPIFVANSSFECEVSESANIGTIVCETRAIDHDSGLDGSLQYQIINSTDSIFAINSQTAQIILTGEVNYERREYFLVIKVCDSAVSPLCTLADAHVTVVDENVQPDESNGVPLQELIEVEGVQNSVIIRVQNLSLKLWFEGARENFKTAMARSVTQFCALFPETCSLVSGCAVFYSSRKKRSTESYYNFADANIIVLPGYPVEAVMNDTMLLEVHFYVSLPDDANKAPLRDTNYVIPRSAMNEIVQLDSGIIAAIVRDSVSTSFTQESLGSSAQSSGIRWKEATIAISVIAAVSLSVILMVMIVIGVYKYKQRFQQKHTTKVIPISCNSKKSTLSEQSSASCSSTSNGRNRRQQNSNSKRVSETSALCTQSPSDQCSLISLGDNEHASMENNPSRGSVSQKEILTDLESSIKLHGEGLPTSNQDYLQNWPYSPPRAFGSTLRPGHARVSAWTTGRHLK